MITSINEFKNINESTNKIGDNFMIGFKISMPRTEGRIVYPNIQERNMYFELIDISEHPDDSFYNIYTYEFRTGVTNKYIKPKRKEEFFYRVFGDKLFSILNGHKGYKLIFDEDKFDGKIKVYKQK